MTTRINARFHQLKQEGRAGLVTFTMAYDPNRAISMDILQGLPAAGADIIELGMPFSDPMADGPAIEAAGLRALQAGAKLRGVLEMVQMFRQGDTQTPLVLMGYLNPIQHYGTDAFVKDAASAGVDGLIIVDAPYEEDGALFAACEAHGVSLIKLVTPTTTEKRLQTLVTHASGFIYYVSVAGVTGAKSASVASIEKAVSCIRKHTSLPVAVGFGIKTAQAVQETASHADAVVVGSALVSVIENAKHRATPAALEFVKELASGLKVKA